MAKKKAAAKKKEGTYIAKAPIRRLMKKEGADLVASKALEKLIEFLEKQASDATYEILFKKRSKVKSIEKNL